MITGFYVLPNYYAGHSFMWEVDELCVDPHPWTFRIEVSDDGQQNWTVFQDGLVNVFEYASTEKPNKTNKDLDPFYRVVMNTGNGREYVSPVKGLYGDLPKRDFLQVREIMRKEHLTMSKKGGVAVQIWKRRKTGEPCQECTDEITGEIIKKNCPACMGTGIVGGFSGPYTTWAVFSLRKSAKKFDGLVPTDTQIFNIRVIGHPLINNGDILVDIAEDRSYIVDSIDDVFEMRRIPIIMQLIAYEETTTSIIYKLGDEPRDDDTCGNSRVYP